MKANFKTLTMFVVAMLVMATLTGVCISQDALNTAEVTAGRPEYDEAAVRISEYENSRKAAVESGNHYNATESESMIGEIRLRTDNNVVFGNIPDESNTDWTSSDPVIFNGNVSAGTNERYKNMDMKTGEDGNLYVAIVRRPTASDPYTARIDTYRSGDGGKNWAMSGWFAYVSGTIGGLSLLVESKNNSVGDSTRLIVFFTYSTETTNANAEVRMASFRRNGTAPLFGTVALPSSGNQFFALSAVSDGAFWQAATYFGFVVSERRNDNIGLRRLKFFRTANWGASWTTAEYTTGVNDVNPSAQFFPGSPAEIMIATERILGVSNRKIAIIRSTWAASSTYEDRVITYGDTDNYLKPCLTVKQNNPADSMLLTCTKNGWAVYFFSTNAGYSWVIDASLSYASSGTNKSFTWCSSLPSGENPFTAIYMTSTGDSLTIRRGVPGAMGVHKHLVNTDNLYTLISPVCATWSNAGINTAAVAYAGSSGQNVYFDLEGMKTIGMKLAIQGIYDAALNTMTRSDTIRLSIKSAVSPFSTIDSVSAVFDPATMTFSAKISGLNSGLQYYPVIRHRNSLETWGTATTASSGDSIWIDMSNFQNKAFGNNLIQVDSGPIRFAIYSGDVNQDGAIDGTDLALIENDAYNFSSGYLNTDIDGNNFVDASDIAFADNNATMFISAIRP